MNQSVVHKCVQNLLLLLWTLVDSEGGRWKKSPCDTPPHPAGHPEGCHPRTTWQVETKRTPLGFEGKKKKKHFYDFLLFFTFYVYYYSILCLNLFFFFNYFFEVKVSPTEFESQLYNRWWVRIFYCWKRKYFIILKEIRFGGYEFEKIVEQFWSPQLSNGTWIKREGKEVY